MDIKNNKDLIYKFYQTMIFGVDEFNKINLAESIKICVNKAYDDNARVLSGVAISGVKKEKIINFLVPKYEAYFRNKPNNFDDWHEKLCDELCKFYESFKRSKKGKGLEIYGFEYGNAQKIINMTFKYLFCVMCDNNYGFEDYVEYFKPCHLTLDRFIINAILDNDKNNRLKYLNWSQMKKAEYLNFQQVAREVFGEDEPLFFKEFKLWNLYKQKMGNK